MIGFNKQQGSEVVKISDSISVIRFSQTPLPTMKEVKGKEWVYYGEDNMYPDFLLKLYNSSGKHGAIIGGKKDYIFGGGLIVKNDITDTTIRANAMSMLAKANRSGETWNDVAEKAILDYEIFHSCYVQIIYQRVGGKIAEIYHLDFSKIRTNDDCSLYFYSNDWSKSNQSPERTGFRIISAYNPEYKYGTQIICLKGYRPNMNVYSTPEYQAIIKYIEIDCEIANFHNNNIKNGFWGGQMITMTNGTPTAEEQKVIERKFKRKFAGTDNAGQFIIMYADNKDSAPVMAPLTPSDLDKQFELLNTQTEQEIYSGHKVTSPMLFGIKTEGQLGGRQELLDAYELFSNTYVKAKQNKMAKFFNDLAAINGIVNALEFKPTEPVTQQFTEQTLVQVLTKNEIREKIGYPPVAEQAPAPAPTVVNPAAPAANNTFKTARDDAKDIVIFSKFGRPSGNFIVLKERFIRFDSQEDFDKEHNYFSNLHKAEFALSGTITDIQASILNILKKTPGLTYDKIASQLKISESRVKESILDMIDGGYLEKNGKEISITDIGSKVAPPDAQTIDISVVYEYDVAPGLGEKVISTTRDFCRQLIELNRKYTRLEIEQISQEAGYSVWMERGGFYRNPQSGITTPYCRHIWKQQIVKKIS